MVTNAEPAYEDRDPDDVKVTGARGTEAELLALAWSGPAGTDAVRLLLELSDSEFGRITATASIRSQECVDAIEELRELLVDDYDLLKHIQSRADGWNINCIHRLAAAPVARYAPRCRTVQD